MKLLLVLSVTAIAAATACNSVQTSTCTPGQSVVCGGPDGCSGYQVCRADGSAFDECICGAPSTSDSSASSTGATSSTTGAGGGSSTATSTAASSGSGGSGPFSPLDLPGLVLWLDDDQGVIEDPQAPGNLLKWQDQSPNGFLATVTSGGGHLQIDPAAINGHDAFICHNRLAIDDDPALDFGTGAFGIALVVKTAPGMPTAFWQKDDIGYSNAQQFTAPDFLFQLGGGSGPKVIMATQNPAKFHAIILRGPAMQMYADGMAATGPTSTADLDSPGWPLWLCIDSGTGAEIAEAIAVKGTLSDSDVVKLQGYFATKFNL